MTKAYKIEVLVIDHKEMGEKEIVQALENTRYVYPRVMKVQSADVGEWSDDHPLNKRATSEAEYRRLFGG